MTRTDTSLKILKVLLEDGPDISLNQIGKVLDMPSSQIFYHVKRLEDLGVLYREETEDTVRYYPQQVFIDNVEETRKILQDFNGLIVDGTDKKIANCLYYFLLSHDGY